MDGKFKFDVGDEIWVIYDCKGEWSYSGAFVVTGILINLTGKKYLTKYSSGIDEEYCFATEQEAEQECNKRNGEKKLFDPGFCYWSGLNPCTECRDKSKCLECTKSIEYIQEFYNEIVKNLKEQKDV